MKATVMLPTTGDRGPILKYSVGSVLNQTTPDWELFIVGDGADESTRVAAEAIAASDARIRYFDFPKHESRGEPNRHQLLMNEARGDIVCYLCDRDLYLENHIDVFHRALQNLDFAQSLFVRLCKNGDLENVATLFAHEPAEKRAASIKADAPFRCPLPMAGHRLDAYKKLPHGWRTTPSGSGTDVYMWRQFLAQPWVRSGNIWIPTVVYMKRGPHPGLPTAERMRESERYKERYLSEHGLEQFMSDFNWFGVFRNDQRAPGKGSESPLQRLRNRFGL